MKRMLNYQAFCLNEAEKFAPEDLKVILKKDPELSILLKKDSKFEDIKDPKKFFETVKRVFLNNQEIVKYSKDTSASNEFGWAFTNLRKLKPEEFTEDKFYMLKDDLLKDFLKSADRRSKGGLSTETKKAVVDWINAPKRRHEDKSMTNELDNIPSLKPEKAIKIYRGMLWATKYDFEKNRDGRKFLESIRKGKDIVDYSDDKSSSWTTSIETAAGFAKARAAATEFGATLNWLYQSQRGDKIDGELGAIIMILAKPEDIIADLSRVNNKMTTKFAWEDEIILRPGKYTAKIVKLYDKKEGEVDPKTYFDSLEADSSWDEHKKVYNDMEENWMPKADKLLNADDKNYRFHHGSGSAFDPKTAMILLPLEKNIDEVFTELFGYIKGMGFEKDFPTKSTDDELRKLFNLRNSGFSYVSIKKKEGVFYKYDTAENLKKDLADYLWYGDMMSELSKFLKDTDVIKRELSHHKRETAEQYKLQAFAKLLDAAGEKSDGTPEEVIKSGTELARRIEVINKQLYWINKAHSAVEENQKKMAA